MQIHRKLQIGEKMTKEIVKVTREQVKNKTYKRYITTLKDNYELRILILGMIVGLAAGIIWTYILCKFILG